MNDFTDWNVTEAMIKYGGSFVQGLGQLYRQADTANRLKLRDAFPNYFTHYLEIAKLKFEEENDANIRTS